MVQESLLAKEPIYAVAPQNLPHLEYITAMNQSARN